MKDPEAAQFRSLSQCSGDLKVWSGDVNGKNSFGAYKGFKPFFYAEGVVAFAGETSFTSLMDRCYSDQRRDAAGPVANKAEGAEQLSHDLASTEADDLTVTPAENLDGDVGPMDAEPDVEEVAQADTAAQARCWADYCPCDTEDPDYGGADVTLCRELKMGQPVSGDLFSGAAAMRDARKSLREFKEQNGGF